MLPPDIIFLWPKCTKVAFDWCSAPDPAGRAYSVPPGPLAVFKRPTSKGREGKRSGGKEGRGGEGKGEEEGLKPPPQFGILAMPLDGVPCVVQGEAR